MGLIDRILKKKITKSKPSYIKRFSAYTELQKDKDCQIKENARKQELIDELKRKLREQKATIDIQNTKIEELEKIIKEFRNDREITRGRYNTGNKRRGRKPSKQKSKI